MKKLIWINKQKSCMITYAVLSIIIISFFCFMVFDYHHLGMDNIFTLASTLVQIFCCGIIGYYLSKKMPNSYNDDGNTLAIKVVRIVFAIAITFFLFIPEIRWRISDFVIQIGNNDFDSSLLTSSVIKQFIVTRLVSFDAVLAFSFCILSYYFFRRKGYNMMNKKIVVSLLVIAIFLSLSSLVFP